MPDSSCSLACFTVYRMCQVANCFDRSGARALGGMGMGAYAYRRGGGTSRIVGSPQAKRFRVAESPRIFRLLTAPYVGTPEEHGVIIARPDHLQWSCTMDAGEDLVPENGKALGAGR